MVKMLFAIVFNVEIFSPHTCEMKREEKQKIMSHNERFDETSGKDNSDPTSSELGMEKDPTMHPDP